MRDRLAIIDHGKIYLVEDTPSASWKASVGGDKIYEVAARLLTVTKHRCRRVCCQMSGVTGVEPIEGGLRVLAKAQDGLLAHVVTTANEFGLRDVMTTEPSKLETVFIRLTGRDLRE